MLKRFLARFRPPLSIEDELLIAHHELLRNPSITSYTMDDEQVAA